MHLMKISALVACSLILMLPTALAGAKSPSEPVCNQASPHFQGGGLVALDPPTTSPAARYTTNLSVLPGRGEGLVNAAAKSPALTICGPGATGGGGGGSET
jgi:hypothetical protein